MGEEDFRDPLILEYIDGSNWRLQEAFTYQSEHVGLISVPRGFVTDFASIPRFFWRILPPTGKYGKAAVVHDWLYRSKRVERKVADLVFLEAMTDLGVPAWQRNVMYAAVRALGWAAYGGGRGTHFWN